MISQISASQQYFQKIFHSNIILYNLALNITSQTLVCASSLNINQHINSSEIRNLTTIDNYYNVNLFITIVSNYIMYWLYLVALLPWDSLTNGAAKIVRYNHSAFLSTFNSLYSVLFFHLFFFINSFSNYFFLLMILFL